ncbi:DUF2059 domain-containing protein [Moraxella pluranimalium]|uniref:DUF2059 domain-containing protein n=1 Tax=Moraxella pluranimalium TaxID=470453 RepID=A0A1T0CV73_9GAMM|nr:hypothetical protein [Moraxella pluranimalium]OOS26254.1 hypothetical protein B0680_00250 [Moraxella pluranimalium]
MSPLFKSAMMIVGTLCVGMSSAIAQTPSDASLRQTLALLDFNSYLKQGSDTSGLRTAQIMAQNAKEQYQLTDDQVERLTQVYYHHLKQNSDLLFNESNIIQELQDEYIELAKLNFNQDEIDAYNQFLSTPAGKRFAYNHNAFLGLYLKAELESVLAVNYLFQDEISQIKLQMEKEAAKIISE